MFASLEPALKGKNLVQVELSKIEDEGRNENVPVAAPKIYPFIF